MRLPSSQVFTFVMPCQHSLSLQVTSQRSDLKRNIEGLLYFVYMSPTQDAGVDTGPIESLVSIQHA